MTSEVPAPRSLTFGALLVGDHTRGIYRVRLDDAATEDHFAEIPSAKRPWGGANISQHLVGGETVSLQPAFAFCSLEAVCQSPPSADALRGLLAQLLHGCAEQEDLRLERPSVWVAASGDLHFVPGTGAAGDTARTIATILLNCLGGVPGPDPVAALAPLWALTTDEGLYRAAARGLRGQAGALSALKAALGEPPDPRIESAWRSHCGAYFAAHPDGPAGTAGPWTGKRLSSAAPPPISTGSAPNRPVPQKRQGRALIMAGSGLFSTVVVSTLGVLALFLLLPKQLPKPTVPTPAPKSAAKNPFEEEPPSANPFAEEEPTPPEVAPTKAPSRPTEEPRPRPSTRSPAPEPEPPEEPEEEEEASEPARPAPPDDHGRVVIQGNARSVTLRGAAGNFGPGSVPAGAYQIFASFDGGPAVEAGNLRVTQGQTVTLVCRSGLGRCTAR